MLAIKCNSLEAEMKRIGKTRSDVAKLINVSYSTVCSRFKGESQWLYTECVIIRDSWFPKMELSYLFKCQ